MEKKIRGFSKEDLMSFEVNTLRTIFHERTHHTIEVLLYRILNGKLQKPENFGWQAKYLLDIWEARGFPIDTPDIQWCITNIEIAEKLNAGETVVLETKLPEPFTTEEMEVVKKLIYERRSIRQFSDKPIPKEMLRKILDAGLWAPQGCNVGTTRYIVLTDPEEQKMVRSDIPIENAVMILVCQDLSGYQALRFDGYVPQNLYFDAAAAADHICLMAHALGLGACWLTHGSETHKKIREHFGLPETFISRCHIILGWPAESPIKSGKMTVDLSLVKR
jgi:nitroreductase